MDLLFFRQSWWEVSQSVGIDGALRVPDAGRVAFTAACDTTDCRRESISSMSILISWRVVILPSSSTIFWLRLRHPGQSGWSVSRAMVEHRQALPGGIVGG